MEQPQAVEPDGRDWDYVSRDGCAECGFEPVPPERIPGRIREAAMNWLDVLRMPGVAARPAPRVWSPLEYACHVRDIAGAFADRLERVLAHPGARVPVFDEVAASRAGDYARQRADEVADSLERALFDIAAAFVHVPRPAWGLRGLRADGMAFTIASMSNNLLHELEHHLHDASGVERPVAARRR